MYLHDVIFQFDAALDRFAANRTQMQDVGLSHKKSFRCCGKKQRDWFLYQVFLAGVSKASVTFLKYSSLV
jgi:hypothetical protein